MTEFFRASRRTDTTEETATLLAERYGQVSIDSDRIVMREEHLGDARFSISRVELIGSFHASHDVSEALLVVRPTTGGGVWRIGDDSGSFEHTPLLLQPGPPVLTRLDDLREGVLALDSTGLEAVARAIYADDRLVLRFDDDPRPIDAHAAGLFNEVFDLAIETRNSLKHELVRSSTYRLLAVATLDAFRLVGDRKQRRETATGLLRAYQRAVAFLDSCASLPITAVDAAAEAGVSLAHLRAAFRAHSPTETGPEQYLRRTRLSAAHSDLIAADPTRGDTVHAIATRWGFIDPSTFARHYRTAYGANPKHVLDR